MIDAVIFDMDGVITDTEPGHFYSINCTLKNFGCKMSEAQHREYSGRSGREIWTELVELYSIPQSVDECLEQTNKYRQGLIQREGIKLIDGSLDLIRSLHQNNIPLAVASSAPLDEIREIVHQFQLNSYFQALVSGVDCKASKPNPEIFIRAGKALETKPEQCLVIEDTRNGVLAAQRAGMHAIGFCNPNFGLPHIEEADFEVNNMRELTPEICISLRGAI